MAEFSWRDDLDYQAMEAEFRAAVVQRNFAADPRYQQFDASAELRRARCEADSLRASNAELTTMCVRYSVGIGTRDRTIRRMILLCTGLVAATIFGWITR